MGAEWVDHAVREYHEELLRLAERHHALTELNNDEIVRWARRGARATVAPMLWAEAVGDRLDTRAVTLLLGVSRQALNQRLTAGGLLGIPGRGTTWFPVWQFDRSSQPARVRPETTQLLNVWRETLGDRHEPLAVASWATTSEPGELEGLTPADWLVKHDGDDGPLLRSAKRAAAGLAQ